MAKLKITLTDVAKKHLKIVSYLLASGLLGWVMAKYVANDPALTAIFAPAINYILWNIEIEKKNEGIGAALQK